MSLVAGLIAAVFLGCAAPAPARQIPEMGRGVDLKPWIGMPTPALALDLWDGPVGACEADIAQDRVRFVVMPDAQALHDACHNATPGLAGCMGYNIQRYPGEPAYHWIVLHPDHARQADILPHELAHWVMACSGTGGTDADHDDPRFSDLIAAIMEVTVPAPDLTAAPTPEMALDVWTGPVGACAEQAPLYSVRAVDRTTLDQQCPDAPADGGCYLGQVRMGGIRADLRPWGLVADGTEDRPLAEAQALVGWLFECSGEPYDAELAADTVRGLLVVASRGGR